MKRKLINPLFLLLVISIGFLFLSNSCKKDEIEVGKVSDMDGNSYKTVKIGNQWWMAENLKTTQYNDGTLIPLITDDLTWKGLTNGAYCWYGNYIANKTVYGALYNWYAINTNKLCPTGWHVPAYEDWKTLRNYLGGRTGTSGKLKEIGTKHWISPNDGATNETGFTALPGGYRHPLGPFLELGSGGYWWLTTETTPETAWSIIISGGGTFLFEERNFEKMWGFSVRCIKDQK
jgi:uncharacterized protein (TIGR02145 family)